MELQLLLGAETAEWFSGLTIALAPIALHSSTDSLRIDDSAIGGSQARVGPSEQAGAVMQFAASGLLRHASRGSMFNFRVNVRLGVPLNGNAWLYQVSISIFVCTS